MAVRIIKEGNDDLFDSQEYRAERMLDYIIDYVEDLKERYNSSIELNGSIEDGLFREINKLYNLVD